jgi:signal transduction histidine kinase
MFRSLRARLAISFLAIVLITLVTAGIAFYARLGGYQEELAATTLRQVAAPIYYNVSLFRPAETQRPAVANQRLRSQLDEYLELQQAEGIIVFPVGSDGHVIANDIADVPEEARDEAFIVPPAPAVGPNFRELPLYRYTTSEGDELVYVSVPMTRAIRAQREGINAVIIALPETGRRGVFADLFPRLLFAGLVGAGAAALAVLLLSAWIYRPLGKVTRGVRAVAAGDYAQRVPVEGPAEVQALARDVNTMADSVETSQRTLREFLANVSHELNTPLTSIRGFSQALQDGTLESPEERARAARVIDAESRRVLRLVGELLDLSRIESGQHRMRIADVRINELLAHVSDVFTLRAQASELTFDVHANAPGIVRADFDRIEQVLSNLIDNAFRHTPTGGRVEVGARERDDMIELYVADSGEGIAAADVERVFDRFYRSGLDAPSTAGNGLGLAISREIVRAHGGAISARSRAGGGVTVAFTLPRADAPPDGPRAAPHIPAPRTSTNTQPQT